MQNESIMKFLHITDGDKKFIPSYIDFIKDNFNEGNHEFIVYSRFKKKRKLNDSVSKIEQHSVNFRS